jgi:GDPmannose 4,6-dehydratase
VRELVDVAFDQAGIEVDDHVVIDESFLRPAEVDLLVGDASKAKRELDWEPQVGFDELVRMMVDADLKLLQG